MTPVCIDVVRGLRQAKKVSHTGTALIGQQALDALKANQVAINVIKPIRMKRGERNIVEYEVSFDGLDAAFAELTRLESAEAVASQPAVSDVVSPDT